MNNEPIRILHVIGVMHRGGAETMIMNFYRHIDRSKVQFDFVENEGMQAVFDEEIHALGGRTYRCPHYNGRNHGQYVKWWKNFIAVHGGEYKAVHGHVGSTAAIYLSIAKKAGIYAIAHSHNTSRFSLKGLVYQAYAYPTRYIADFFFGCSLDAGISRYGKKLCAAEERFKVLNNAIETEIFSYSENTRTSMRRHLGVNDKIVIGHVGRFAEQKNHAFLVRIFEEIHRMNPDTVLLLIGDGELRSQIEHQVRQAGMVDSVIFAGVQSDVSAYYQAMDAFIFPSLYEGLGIVAIEAQAAGVPCIISDKVSTECVVTDNLVTIQKLRDSPKSWAQHILSRGKELRKDHSQEVKESGYDIQEVARWLENYYIKIGENCNVK